MEHDGSVAAFKNAGASSEPLAVRVQVPEASGLAVTPTRVTTRGAIRVRKDLSSILGSRMLPGAFMLQRECFIYGACWLRGAGVHDDGQSSSKLHFIFDGPPSVARTAMMFFRVGCI